MVTITPVATSDLCSETSPLRPVYVVLARALTADDYTTSNFSEAALAIGRSDENLDLVDGFTFLNRIQRLTLPAQIRLFEVATEGDYTTPTCPNCGVKMVIRTARKGKRRFEDLIGVRAER